jgi:hypothetical protein
MMPGMIHQAMQGGAYPAPAAGMTAAAATASPMPPAPGPAAATVAAAATSAGMSPPEGVLDFGDLSTPIDVKAIVRAAAQSAAAQIVEGGDVWQLTIPVGPLRKQQVAVAFNQKDDQGNAIISYSSTCGPATEQNALALLKYNTKMVYGAFAIVETPSGNSVVLQANQLASAANQPEVTKLLTAVAWQADKVEEKLGGGDNN